MPSSADSDGVSSTGLMEKVELDMPSSVGAALPHWTYPVQQEDMAMPHRNRHPIRSALKKLFSRKKLTPVSSGAIQPDLQERVSHKPFADFVPMQAVAL